MKNYLLFLLFSASLMLNAQIDDIESYPEGSIFTDRWTTWTSVNDEIQNAIVTNEKANSGTKSVVIEFGEQNALYSQGGTAKSGTWKAEWNMLVPTGHSGYFHAQGNQELLHDTSGRDGLVFLCHDVTFNPINRDPGVVLISGSNNEELGRANFTHDEWFKIAVVIHLDNNDHNNSFYKLYLNDELILDNTPINHFESGYPSEEISGFDAVGFYGPDPASKFYIDDIVFSEVDILSTSNLEETKFSFFPNPVKDVLHINSKNKIIKKLTIYNNLGQIVSENHPNTLSPNINTSSLNSGLYLVNILTNDGNKQTLKIMK